MMHVDPSAKFSNSERDEFLRVAQVLCARHKQHTTENKEGAKPKRNYKRWSPNEIHNLLVAISICGTRDLQNLEMLVASRSASQVRSIAHERVVWVTNEIFLLLFLLLFSCFL